MSTYWQPPRDNPDEPAPWSTETAPPMSPVAPMPPPTPAPVRTGRRRLRWAVAVVATAIVVVAAGSLAFFATGASTTSAIAPTFLPPSTFAFAEARLDLPGTQRDNVIKLIGHLPGFADPAAFDTKIDQTLDDYLGQMSDQKVVYTRDIKPWFGGEVAVALLKVPSGLTSMSTLAVSCVPQVVDCSTSQPAATPMPPGTQAALAGDAIAAAGVKDRALLESTIDGYRSQESGLTYTDEQYAGTTVTTAKDASGTVRVAWAVTDTLLLLGASPDPVKSSLDILAGTQPSLAKDPTFRQVFDGVASDRVADAYIDSSQYSSLMGSLPNAEGAIISAVESLPARVAYWISAEPDHLTIDYRALPGVATASADASSSPAVSTSTVSATDLAARMPADAMVYVEASDVGSSIHKLVAAIEQQYPDALSGAEVKQIETALGSKLGDYLDFVKDVGIYATYSSGKFQIGLVASVRDAATATARIGSLLTTLRLVASAGLPVTVTDSQVAGVTVSTIAYTGSTTGLGTVPIDTSVSVAVTGGELFLGTGDFAAQALGRQPADSLAGDQRYASALSSAGTTDTGVIYVDITGIRAALEGALGSSLDMMAPTYTSDIKPYLEPFDRAIVVTGTDNGLLTSRIQLFLK